MYDNLNDASRYLSSTVCYWDGVPVYVSDMRRSENNREEFDAYCYELPYNGARADWRNISDPRFNAFKFQMGYMNIGDSIRYMSRRPARIQSQGLCGNNTSIIGGNGMNGRGEFTEVIRHQGFKDMLMGVYPTIEEARQKLMENPRLRGMAFSREFAIKRHRAFNNLFFLSYKGEDISYSDTAEFSLSDDFSHLKEITIKKGALRA